MGIRLPASGCEAADGVLEGQARLAGGGEAAEQDATVHDVDHGGRVRPAEDPLHLPKVGGQGRNPAAVRARLAGQLHRGEQDLGAASGSGSGRRWCAGIPLRRTQPARVRVLGDGQEEGVRARPVRRDGAQADAQARIRRVCHAGRRLGVLHHADDQPTVSRALQGDAREHGPRGRADVRNAPTPRSPTRRDTVHRVRDERTRADEVVLGAGVGVPGAAEHEAADAGVLFGGLARGPAGVDLREAARLDRPLPLDRRRGLHLGRHLLVLHRRPRRKPAHLLRGHPRVGQPRPQSHPRPHPPVDRRRRQARLDPFARRVEGLAQALDPYPGQRRL